MFKKLFLSLVAFVGMSLGLAQAQTPVHTPTLEGTYNWPGVDTWPFGNLRISGSIPQCAAGTVMNGFQIDLTPNCVPAQASFTGGFSNSVGSGGLTSGATTLTLATSTAGYPTHGCGYIDSEYMCYSSLDPDGFSLDGLQRGKYATTAAAHGATATWHPAVVVFAADTGVANAVIFGGVPGGQDILSINNAYLESINPTPSLVVNGGSNRFWVGTNGVFAQQNVAQCCNVLAGMQIGTGDIIALNQDFITQSQNVVQITNQYEMQQVLGLGAGIAGGVSFHQPATIGPPLILGNNPSGTITYTYMCQDHAGLVPGTPASILNTVSPPGPFGVQCPRQAGVVSYDILRLAGGTGGVGIITGGLNVPPGANVFDNPNAPATGTTIIGSNTSKAFIDGLDYLKAGDLYDLNLAISSAPLCVGASHILTTSGCTGGGSSITLTCTGTGLTCPLVGSNYAIALTGGAGTGAVGTGSFAQMAGFASTGTTVGGAPNMFVLNPGFSLNQITGLFSRFAGVTVTSYSITSNVVTMQGINAFNVGDVPDLVFFPTSTFFNNQHPTIISTGLSNTQFEFAFTHADTGGSVTEIGYASLNTPQQPIVSAGVVFIPPNFLDNPSSAFVNGTLISPAGQVVDVRKGRWFQQLSGYGVKCDAQQLFVTLTAGSNLVNVGSSFSSSTQPINMTMVVGQQVGYGNTGTQNVWTPTVIGYPFPNLQLSSNAPFNFSGTVTFGTNNQAAIQRAFNDVGGFIPLYVPQCAMLTDTVRWNGANLLGQQMNDTTFFGFPGHDIFQQQDGIPLLSWSINASTGVTTFTIPAYSAHNLLLSDSINLRSFPTATFFNNQNVIVASIPTPTTFTVNSAFGQSTSSGSDLGLSAPNTTVNTNGLRLEHIQFAVNNSIDPTFKWNSYDANATLTVQPPMYRPAQEHNQPMNHPFAPGWGQGQVNGVANIVQNTAVICVPTASGARSPVLGTTIVFPYQTGGLFTAAVNSTAGSCGGGLTPFTMSAAFPNTSGYTATQAEWFTYTTPQTLAVAMPATITLPYTIQLALPFPPVPGWEANVASHGHIIIGSQEWDYMGDNFGGTAGGNPTLTLRNGPTTVNGGSGYAIGSIVFPLNPCQAMYHNPWPVIPSINSGNATPVNATYYAGICMGNAGISLPMSDADLWAPFGNSGFSIAHFSDVSGINTNSNALGNANNNGSMLIWEQGNYTGYGNTFDDIRVAGLMGGFMQGPASVNQHGVRTVGPTSTGQSLNNCTFRTGYAMTFMNFQQSAINRCDTYSTEVSPYDGTVVGASTGLFLGYTLSEQDGGGVTGTAQLSIRDYNNEPENGNHDEFPPSVVSDANISNWTGTLFEGGYNIFGGSYQIFHGSQIATPIFNYGTNNYWEHMSGLNTGYSTNVYDGTPQFYNWGRFSQAECSNGVGGGANTICAPGMIQSYNGHDAFATLMGDPTHPNQNLLGGMVVPGEFATAGAPLVFDPTELHWGQHIECGLNTFNACIYQQFDGFNGYIYIGPFQRITDARTVLKLNIKLKSAGTFNFRVRLSAQNASGGSICTPNFALADGFFTATSSGWTPVQMPVNFTGYAGCTLGVQFDSSTTTNTLEVGYFNFVPFPGQLYIPLGTHSVNDPCPVAGEISLDSAHFWTCSPLTGVAFGAGTWQQH